MVAAHPSLEHYHFGWYSEMSHEHQNNYDPTGQVGNQYPALFVIVDGGTMEYNPDRKQVTMPGLVFSFVALRGFDDQGNSLNKTKPEQWSDLFLIATQYFDELKRLIRTDTTKQLSLEVSPGGALNEGVLHKNFIELHYRVTVRWNQECTPLGLTLPDAVTDQGITWPVISTDLENTITPA